MIQAPVLSEVTKAALRRVYDERYPNEACGIILPTPYRGHQFFELPNRSKAPRDNFVMTGGDIRLTIEDWINDNGHRLFDVIFWHTHPSGNSRPSEQDIKNQVVDGYNLIFSVTRAGEEKLHWY